MTLNQTIVILDWQIGAKLSGYLGMGFLTHIQTSRNPGKEDKGTKHNFWIQLQNLNFLLVSVALRDGIAMKMGME